MPKVAKELTVPEVKKLGSGTFALGGLPGFYIRKKNQNSGRFFFRYKDSGGRHDYSLGPYPFLSLAHAKKLCYEARLKLMDGISPVLERAEKRQMEKETALQAYKEEHVITFKQLAEDWIADRVKNHFWANNRFGEQDTMNILQRHVFPVIGELDIEYITPEVVRDCLSPIWQDHPATAKKAKTYISKSMQWAIALHKRENRENPASMQGALGVLMESQQNNKREKQNHAACAVIELPELIREIHNYTSLSARAVEFAILTAARSQAVRLASWEEFDLEKGVWTIPLEHDKMKGLKRDRVIYLSRQAIKLLEDLPRFSESPFVFPTRQSSHFSDTALNMFLKGLHEKKQALDGIGWIDPDKSRLLKKPCVITVHGTSRATFRTWAKDDELGNNRRFDQEAVEYCLLHSKSDAYDGAYDRAKFVKERQTIMQAWGNYCYSKI